MPRTVVMPPATKSKSVRSTTLSDACPPGRCACISARPGMRYFPRPSTRTPSLGTFTRATGPISTIRPPRTSTVWPGIFRSRSIGITVTSTNAVTVSGGMAAQIGPLSRDGREGQHEGQHGDS